MASVMQRNRSAQTPVSFVRSLSGLALRLPVSAGPDQPGRRAEARRRKTSGLRTNRTAFSDSHESSVSDGLRLGP